MDSTFCAILTRCPAYCAGRLVTALLDNLVARYQLQRAIVGTLYVLILRVSWASSCLARNEAIDIRNRKSAIWYCYVR